MVVCLVQDDGDGIVVFGDVGRSKNPEQRRDLTAGAGVLVSRAWRGR
jgi:hypothetical protein